jgi:F-type H+-transporting ATPase subunit delta
VANETVARRYAAAVFELAQESGDVEGVGRDLRTMSGAIYEDESTKGFFLSPVIDRKEKERVLNLTFSGKAHEVALHTLLLLVRKRRESLLSEVVRQYGVLEMQARGAEPLAVTTARELSSAELNSLVERLQKVYGKTFEVTQRVDPSLIGGVRIMMGDRRIDGSVEGRLEELSRTLFAKN